MKMSPEIKFTLSENEKLIKTVTKTIENQQLAKTLEEIQVEANAALSKMIEELGDISAAGGDVNLDDDDDDDEDDFSADSSQSASGGHNKSNKGHSKSKKKKHH